MLPCGYKAVSSACSAGQTQGRADMKICIKFFYRLAKNTASACGNSSVTAASLS